MADGRVRMGLSHQLRAIEAGLAIVREFPELDGVPIILGESDPEGCAACPASTHPANTYREGPLYGASVVEATARTMELAARSGIDIEGSVTWAFTFPGRTVLRRLPRARHQRHRQAGAQRVPHARQAWRRTARGNQRGRAAARRDPCRRSAQASPDVDIIATRSGDRIAILVWNYHDDDRPESGAVRVELGVTGLSAGRYALRHNRMDATHSNAHALWLSQGVAAAAVRGAA